MIVKLYHAIGPPGERIDGLIYYFAGGVGMPNGPVWALLAGLKLQYWDGAAWQDFNPAVSDSQLSANVVILTAGVYPAGDGSLITNVPAPFNVKAGSVTLVAGVGTFFDAGIPDGSVFACVAIGNGVNVPVSMQSTGTNNFSAMSVDPTDTRVVNYWAFW